MNNSSVMAVVNSLDQLSEPAAATNFVYVLVFPDDVEKAAILRVLHHNIDPVGYK